ncbi:MAG: hypothetical protein MUF01_13070 [Bryobacterales bacterium]|nr:hypothetical protein [Bryobacterales bacterium]
MGEFIIQLVNSPLAVGIVGALGDWLAARHQRKVRLKIGNIEVDAQTEQVVTRLLTEAEACRQRTQRKRIDL